MHFCFLHFKGMPQEGLFVFFNKGKFFHLEEIKVNVP